MASKKDRRKEMDLELTIPQLFLSFALNRCRVRGILTPGRMLNHFGVETIVTSVAVNNERRADLVMKCVGTKRNSALKQKVEDSARAITLALEVGDTSADEIFDEENGPRGVSTDEIAYYLPGDKVFDLWYHSGWTAGDEDDRAFMSDLWDFIIHHKMFGENTHLDLVMELGTAFFVSDKIPHDLRTAILDAVFAHGEPLTRKTREESSSLNAGGAEAFTTKDLLDVVPPSKLVEHVELTDMARPIVALAKLNGWSQPEPRVLSEMPPPGDASGGPPPLPASDADVEEVEPEAATSQPAREVIIEAD